LQQAHNTGKKKKCIRAAKLRKTNFRSNNADWTRKSVRVFGGLGGGEAAFPLLLFVGVLKGAETEKGLPP
jgi:hypothetical protein